MRFTAISSLLFGSFVPSVFAFTGPSSINHMRSIQNEATLFHRNYASPMTLNVASREVSNSFLPEGVFKGTTGKSRFEDDSIQKKSDSTTDAEYTRGLFTIGFITFLFSSNSPALHAAFVNASSPPPVLLLNAATSTIALMGLVTFGPILNSLVPLPKTLESEETDMMTNIRAGTELGLWKTLGTTANLYGLSMTTANHAAFLIQLTTLIVPGYQGLTGVPIPNRIWTAIGLALAGITMFTQDAAAGGGDIMNNSSLMGDALCALAAVFYATYDLRLFDLGKKVPPLPLIRTKIAVQAVLSCALLAFANEGGLSSAMDYMQDLIVSPDDAILIGSAALWSGLAINAIAPFMQVSGQQTVGASRAQVLYASQPLWASFLSYFLLNETLSEDGMKGGSLFLIAIFFAATAESPEPDCEEKTCEV